MAGSEDVRRPLSRGSVAALAALLLLVAGVHALVLGWAPQPRLFGDEGHYLGFANRDAREGTTGLLPGSLRFDRRPEFGSRLYAQLAGDGVDNDSLLRRIGGLQLAMLLGLIAAGFAQGRMLGLGSIGVLTASALLGLSPWVGFFVYAAWPEIPHLFFLSLAFVCLLGYANSLRLAWLVGAALALGYALFTRGTINAFVPVVVIFVGAATARKLSSESRRLCWTRSAAASGTLVVSLIVVVAPQLYRNAEAGHGWSLAANRWDALEAGIRAHHTDYLDPRPPMDERWEISRTYRKQGETWNEREARARERTLAYIASVPLTQLVADQSRKLGWCLLVSEAFFEQSIGFRGRWGKPAPRWLQLLRPPARALWYATLALGLVGIVLMVFGSPGWLLLGLFVAYILLALFAVPMKIRYALPMLPTLCLFAGASVERVWVAARARAK